MTGNGKQLQTFVNYSSVNLVYIPMLYVSMNNTMDVPLQLIPCFSSKLMMV